jgi:dTDP-4-amino-4,6-dideoxygalactose transaminase
MFEPAMMDRNEFQIPVLVPQVPEPALWTDLLKKSFEAARFSNGGPLAKIAEQEISSYLGGSCEVMVCASNTSGLVASLMAFECRSKKVLVSNYTYAATLNAIHCAGAIPVLCDVDPVTWEISVDQIMKAQVEFPDINAVLITRVHGFIRDIEAVLDYCAAHDLKVVIDAAAAFPGDNGGYKTRPGVAEVFSFHATKPLGIGEGGAVVGDISTLAAVRRASNFGLDSINESFGDGLNAKMDEFAAARLIAALSNFTDYVHKRRKFANELYAIFASSAVIQLPIQTEKTSWPFFPIKFRSTRDLLTFQEDLFPVAQTRRYYYPSMSEGYTGKAETLRTLSLNVSVELAVTSLCLPVIPDLKKKDQERYFNKISEMIKSLPEC